MTLERRSQALGGDGHSARRWNGHGRLSRNGGCVGRRIRRCGDGGSAAAGPGGVVVLADWNGQRHKIRAAEARSADDHGELAPDTLYRLEPNGKWVAARRDRSRYSG
ncbi:MAG TPA: hypothetical protein VFQ91_15420 [Bryobacteraceae bacterium]|nr:hypothetical protein [Bryobacteraceae bacterium]